MHIRSFAMKPMLKNAEKQKERKSFFR